MRTPTPAQAANAALDADLVSRTLAGERDAFNLLVVRYQRRIAALISRYRLDAATIEDLTQDTFVKAYRGLAGFRGESTFFTWLARIALNTTKTHLAERRLEPEPAGGEPGDEEFDPFAAVVSGDTTEGSVVSRQLGEIIAAALEAMPPDLATALTLREIEGLTYEEIAQKTAAPLNTVRSRIFRAREFIALKLRPALEVSRSKRW